MKKRTLYFLLITAAAGAYFAFGRETPQEKEARHLRRGNEFFQAGDLQKARVEYKNAAKLMPLDPEVSFRWGLLEEAEGNIRSAYANFLRAEQQDPNFAPALLKVAHYNLVVDQTAEVKKRLESVLNKNPDNAEALALQSSLLLRESKYDEAEKLARTALEKEPSNITAYSVLVGIAMAKNKREDAEKFINEGIAKNPKDVSLLMLKLRIFESPVDLDKINETYNQLVAIQPKDPAIRMLLADIYVASDKKDQAEETLRAAAKEIPDAWVLKRKLLAFIDQFRGPEASEKELAQMIKDHPERADLTLWQAELYLSHNQVEKAVEVLNQTITRTDDEKSLGARASLARITFKRGERKQAEELVDAILKKSPRQPEALLIRASMLADDGRYQSAVTTLRQLIRDNPRSTDSRKLLAEVLVLQGYPDLAIETLSQLIDIEPTNLSAQVRLAQMYGENKDPTRGISLMENLVKTNPSYAVGWETLARLAITAKDTARAQKAIEVLKSNPETQATANFLSGQLAFSTGGGNVREAFTKVIDTDPDSPLAEYAAYELVEKFHSKAEIEQTAGYLEGLKTKSPYITTLLGECQLQLGQKEKASETFDRAISLNPRTQDAHLNRARLAIEANDTAKASELLEAAHKINPSDPRAHLTLGSMHSKNGDYAAALTVYDDLVTQNPELEVAVNNYAAIVADAFFSDTARLDQAVKLAERFASSKNPVFLDTLAWLYYRSGKTEQAQSTISKAISLMNPAPAPLLFHQGMIEAAAGNASKAKDALKKAIESPEEWPQKAEAEKTLKTLK